MTLANTPGERKCQLFKVPSSLEYILEILVRCYPLAVATVPTLT